MKFDPWLINKTKDYFLKKSGLELTDEVAIEYLVSLTSLGFLLLKTQLKERGDD